MHQAVSPLSWQLAPFDGSTIDAFLQWHTDLSPQRPWQTTSVPSNVQSSAFGLPYPEILLGQNWEKVKWMEERIWVYRTELPPMEAPDGRSLVIRFKGLDYRARIFLNGRLSVDHQGMYSPVEIELPPADLKIANTLHVAFLPAVTLYPATSASSDNVNAAEWEIRHLKARYMKGWDFCPELKCTGIWDEVEIEWRAPSRIRHIGVETRIANVERAEVFVDVHILRPEGASRVMVEVAGASASVPVYGRERVRLGLAVTNPHLWQAHTHGDPILTGLTVTLHSEENELLDTMTRRIGLREISRRHAQGQRPTDTPAQYLVNGIPVFLCGANLTPFSSVPSEVGRADYLKVLEPLKEAGVNFLRVWGGGVREKESFYDLCDEMGFLVMQEFPLACESVSADANFLKILERESRSIVRQLNHHPCIAVWSGGNEHYHFWESVDSGTEQMQAIRENVKKMFNIEEGNRAWRGGIPSDHPALQILQSVVAEESPFAHYNITSGLEEQGETHGPWTFRPEIGDHRFRDFDFYEFWRGAKSALHSESSVSGPAHPETFAGILGLSSLDGVGVPTERSDPLWVAHKAFRAAWDAIDDNWLDITGAEMLFGKLPDAITLIRALSYIQCEGTRFMIESVRRRQGRSTGLVWWGINEPFPALAGNALVDFFGRTKPALDIMRGAFHPHLLSLDYPHLLSKKISGEIFFTNSSASEFSGRFRATTRLDDGAVIDTLAGNIQAPAYSSGPLQELVPLPLGGAAWGTVDLELLGPANELISANRYRFFPPSEQPPLRQLLELLKGDIAGLFFFGSPLF